MKKNTWFSKNPVKGEINTQPSLTQQGQVHSIAEMVKRYENGIPLSLDKRLEWAEENDDEQFTFSDLTDLDIAKDNINRVKAKLAEIKNEPKQEPEPPKITNKTTPTGEDKPTDDDQGEPSE